MSPEPRAEQAHTVVAARPTWGQVLVCSCGAEYAPKETCPNVHRRSTTTPEQDLINAATAIRRIAERPNRHPRTAAILLEAADALRAESFVRRDVTSHPEVSS